MIKAFFVDRDVEGVFRYVNPNHFTWIGPGETEVFTDIDEIRKHFQNYCDVAANAYRPVNEEYILGASSVDSCIVLVKLTVQGVKERQGIQTSLHFTFYFQLVEEKLLVSHYHVNIPVKNPSGRGAAVQLLRSDAAAQYEPLKADLQYHHELLNNFFDSDHVAMKSFYYEERLPYCYVNRAFAALVGCSDAKHFAPQFNRSSLMHIHPEDQQRYWEALARFFRKERVLDPLKEWQWHADYQIFYRLKRFDGGSRAVLEWGNLMTLNGRPIVNSVVLPQDDCGVEERASLLNDCGIQLGDRIVVYPKKQRLLIKEKAVELTPIEFKVFLVLANNINQPVQTQKIYVDIWDDSELKVTSFALKTHISNLRRKIRSASDASITLTYIRGKGYCLRVPEY